MVKFGTGKFNVKSGSSTSITGKSGVEVGGRCKDVLVKKFVTAQTKMPVTMQAKSTFTNIIPRIPDPVEIAVNAKALESLFIFSSNAFGDVFVDAEALSALMGQNYIEIRNVNLEPGEELEINMCDLTVTKNGENALHLMANDGDFFDLLAGDNNIDVEAAGAEAVTVDSYWKDKWL